jgi:perosamine synthetase
MLNSGTAALHLSLEAINLEPENEVITTPFTFAATAEVIEYFNARPVFVDIREDTLNISENGIEEKITSKTRAIIPVHFSGHPCEMDSIMDIAHKHDLYIIEDAAHCTPAYYKGKPIGSLGHLTCFSFYANKCITTGEGGMVTSNDESLLEKIRILRLHGLSNDAMNRYASEGTWKYDITTRGYKYNPTDIAAAIGLEQLKHADSFYQARKKIANAYTQQLKDIPEIQLPRETQSVKSSWHLFPIRLSGNLVPERDRIIQELGRRGITVSVHFLPLHMHSFYRDKYHYRPDDFPDALHASKGILSLPVYPGLKDDEVAFVTENLKEILQR